MTSAPHTGPTARPSIAPTRVAVIGHGAIGAVVAADLAAGGVPGAELVAVVTRTPHADTPAPNLPFDEALDRADLVVEAAGQQALRDHGPAVVESGRTLLVTAVGALADPGLRERLQTGPGRLGVTAGAVGGLDVLAAATHMAPFGSVTLRTTKKPGALVQDWMDEGETVRLREATGPMSVFAGPVAEAARLFPSSLNVAAALALAVDDWDLVRVELVADPGADLTAHHITATGPAGEYDFTIRNRPSPANPRSSGAVPHAVLHTLRGLVGA
ncbi:aspartate dehydrogenase domain-containing protein [Brevibacterium litoralis]|uniref:aspartate dehydrogenase domain-containing protein n=1 Tax=Brevibacterium litoralis TaxID=3138935 RepID=UPI0032EC68D6